MVGLREDRLLVKGMLRVAAMEDRSMGPSDIQVMALRGHHGWGVGCRVRPVDLPTLGEVKEGELGSLVVGRRKVKLRQHIGDSIGGIFTGEGEIGRRGVDGRL